MGSVSFKDQTKRRRAAERRGRRGARRASAMLLKQAVLHPVDLASDVAVPGAPPAYGIDIAADD